MNTFYKILYLFFLITFFSCSQKNKEPIPEVKSEGQIKEEKIEQLDSINKKEAYDLTLKFNAISNEDSSFKFTYQLQEKVKENIKLISFIGNINDIIKKDSNFILKIYSEFAQKGCIVEILVSPGILKKIQSQLDPKLSYAQGCFILKPTSIKSSSMFTIDTDLHLYEDAETVDEANRHAEAELIYDYDNILLFFKGSLVDFYIYKKLPIDDD
jgi:hypothetical protein